MGAVSDMDRVIEKYISKYDIQLENALKELSNAKNLTAFNAANPYEKFLKSAEHFMELLNIEKDILLYKDVSKERAIEIVKIEQRFIEKMSSKIESLKVKRQNYINTINTIEPFTNLVFNLEELVEFEFIVYRFGKMPLSSFKQFETYLYNEEETLFVQSKLEGDYVWCVYFTTDDYKEKIDSIFSSLHFEKISLIYELDEKPLKGNLNSIYRDIETKIKEIDKEIKKLSKYTLDAFDINKSEFISAYKKIQSLYHSYDARKYAAKTEDDFYILVGWMSEKDAFNLQKETEKDDKVILIDEEENQSITSKPPIKLKNFQLFQPFEFFVKMYGFPSYNEIDPTPFVAITYSILYGMMFGDLGQGFALVLLGLYLDKKKGIKLGAIMSVIGLSSMFFGIMYGSVFGFESIIPSVWLRPAKSVNSILITTVIFGVGLIFISMLFNIINSIKSKDIGKLLFSPNGIAGIIFYASVIFTAAVFFIKGFFIGLWFILIFTILPLILITLKEPLSMLIKTKESVIKGSKAQFILETLMELLDILLSYFTNTVSFVRVGGFAISHAGLMGAVMLLSGVESGNPNFIIIILGNILVMVLEGLVVGIQVLRLEFYEMFSRFYTGEGKEFISYKAQNK